jgi:hypothetical protein
MLTAGARSLSPLLILEQGNMLLLWVTPEVSAGRSPMEWCRREVEWGMTVHLLPTLTLHVMCRHLLKPIMGIAEVPY